MSEKVSIIVCTYNREKFILDALNSLRDQKISKSEFEVLVINNNCSDNSPRIIDTFIQSNPELDIQHIIETKQGLSNARNRGIKEAKHPIITFIDDDAIAQEDFVQAIQNFFSSNPDASACGGKVLAKFETAAPPWRNKYSDPLYFSHYDKGNESFIYTGRKFPIGCNMSFNTKNVKNEIDFNPELGRKGKDGSGLEEKEVFLNILNDQGKIYYDPKQVVQHQIDDWRLHLDYRKKLAQGLGQSVYKMDYEGKNFLEKQKTLLILQLKYTASLILSLIYLVKGNYAVSKHLIQFRRDVFFGFYQKKEN